jgi:hypothetical protein
VRALFQYPSREHLVRLVHHQHRTFGDDVQLRVGDQQCHFQDAVGIGREARHLHVDPDEVVLIRRHDVFSHA